MSKLHRLIALAHEPSSAKRRELLREVTDIFFQSDSHTQSDLALFGEVMTQLARELEDEVRIELADRIASIDLPPLQLLHHLAFDTIEVAAPVVEQSPALTEQVLMSIAMTKGQGHLRALSRRTQVNQALADAIIDRGDDETLSVLVHNDGADLSRSAHEIVVARSEGSAVLQEEVVQRRQLPADLLNEMYFVVESHLRQQILVRNAELNPEELEAALMLSRNRLAKQDGSLPSDFAEAEAAVKAMQRAGSLGPRVLASMLRARENTKFLIALASLSEIDFYTARRIVDRRELDALAIICKAANLDRPLFITFAVLMLDRQADAMGLARTYGDLYNALTRDAALRTIRFWRVRRQSGSLAA